MDEAKTLVNMAITAMLSAMFLGVAVGVIGIGYMMWGYFARQDAANKAMSAYAHFTSYDNTTVRGQEVLQLLENDDNIFVVIMQAGSGTNINDMTINTGKKMYLWANSDYNKNFKLKQAYINNTSLTNNAIPTCQRMLQSIYQWTDPQHPSMGSIEDISNKTDTDLEKLFLDPNELGIGDNDFAAFKSTLIYADDSSSEIAGVVLMKQCSTVTF